LKPPQQDALSSKLLTGVARPQPLTLRLEDGPGVTDQIRDLAEREGRCCSFFTFAVAPGESGIPPGHLGRPRTRAASGRPDGAERAGM
jgi:hypothetical protein